MSQYEVRITEILSRIVTVDAEDEIDAQVKVDEMISLLFLLHTDS